MFMGVTILHRQTSPTTPAAAMSEMQQLPGQMLLALLPAGLGALCGAVGLFIAISTLVIHFLGAAADDSRHRHSPSFR
jgi:hypothetical protein